MTTDGETRGGADWELGEAARKLSEILGVEGAQADALRLALSDHAAAVGSKSTAMISALFTPLLQKQVDTQLAIGRIAEQQTRIDTRQQNADTASLAWRTELRTHIDARFDAYGRELDTFKAETQEALRGLGGLEARVERVEIGQAKLEIKVETLETQGAPAKAIDELHTMREANDKRFTRLEIWVACLTLAMFLNAVIYVLIAVAPNGGGR